MDKLYICNRYVGNRRQRRSRPHSNHSNVETMSHRPPTVLIPRREPPPTFVTPPTTETRPICLYSSSSTISNPRIILTLFDAIE